MKPTLVVLAAGIGSRYGGVKQIDPVGKNGECLLDFACYDAKSTGFDKVTFIIRRDIERDFREKLFDRIAANFNADYVFQSRESLLTKAEMENTATRAKPWGTLHAILCAEQKIASPFTVINADDYYGREAFKTMSDYLSGLSTDSTEHAMVGYVLNNTMSKNGSVSRGICAIKDGCLKAIVENTKIYYENSKIVSEFNGTKYELTGKEWVSMNCFGFTTKAFETFHEYWEHFRNSGLYTDTQEALLPTAAGDIIRRGKGIIKFFSSKEEWFGMTYPEDRELVKKAIASKIQAGYYPENLWE